MIDSTFPAEGQHVKEREIAYRAEISTRPEMAEKTCKCMIEAQLQVRQWTPPVWRSSATEILGGQSETTRLQISDTTIPLCPPAILIRATDDSSKRSADLSEPSENEIFEDGKTQALGFDRYENFNLRGVVYTSGDHFSIFNHENVSRNVLTLAEPLDLILSQVNKLSKKVKEACDILTKRSSNIYVKTV